MGVLRRGQHGRRITQGGIWALGSGAATIAILLVLSPLGGSVRPASKISPPFTGATASPNTQWSQSGCGKATVTSYSKWSPTTGVGVFGGTANAKSACKKLGSVGGQGSGGVYGSWYLTIPVTLPSGTHSVQPNWTIAYTATERMVITKLCPAPVLSSTGYGTSYCRANAGFDFYFYTDLVDQTNGSYFNAGNYFPGAYNSSFQYNDTYCSSGTCRSYNYSSGTPASVSATVPFVWYINGTFNGSHQYNLYVNFGGSLFANAAGYGSSVAVASLTMHNGLTMTRLNSIGVV
jgi:hypothetical protein